MNRLLKKLISLSVLLSVGLSANAATPIESDRVLTPPIWMQPDVLIDNENVAVAHNDIMQPESAMGFTESYQGKLKFTNRVDGYSIVIPSDMSVDLSLSDVCAKISNDYTEIRIFKETFDTASERLSYQNYSNKFSENKTDHTITKESSFSEGNREYRIIEWSRKKLEAVRADKNYYTCIDVSVGARVYTFFARSSRPFTMDNDCLTIAKSLTTFDPSVAYANAYNKGYKKTEVSGLNNMAQVAYNNLFGDNTDFKMGIFLPDKFGGYKKIPEFENELNYNFSTILVYTEVTDKGGTYAQGYNAKVSNYMRQVQTHFTYAQSAGKVIELTLQTPLKRDSSKNMVYEILNGEYDAFLSAYGKLIASYPNVTVLMRPFNEMNGDWCNYSAFHTSRDPGIYVELYRYVHNKIMAENPKNIIWVWNPNERSFPNFKWNSQDLYYPGDDYVDVYGITGYNTGNYYEGERWRSFDEIYAPIYERAMRINEKPIMITEFSCSAIGGDKIKWIEDMFSSIQKYPKIKLGIWWHATDYDGENLSRPYFMDTPEGTMDIFKKYLIGGV